MKILSYKKHGIDFHTVWFADEPIRKNGIIQYRQANFEINKADEFQTLISELNIEADEIISKFSKNCKYEVNRAQREGFIAEFYDKNNIDSNCIEKFLEFFLDFWKSKGVMDYNIASVRSEIECYIRFDSFVLSKAKFGEDTVVYHTYFVDDTHARLLHSASLYRDDGVIPSQLIGMANRYLHKEDMMYFKNTGKVIYDWGGAGIEDEVINITKFKESFGGTRVVQYNARVHKGLLAKMFKLLIEKK